MTREQLEQFVEFRLRKAKQYSGTTLKETLFNQAFGAVEFYCECHPDEEIAVGEWWNNEKWNEFWEVVNNA